MMFGKPLTLVKQAGRVPARYFSSLNVRSSVFAVRAGPLFPPSPSTLSCPANPRLAILSRFSISIQQKKYASDLKAVNINERTADDRKERSRKIKNVIVLGLLILMPIVCFNLGNWQYRRLHWKNHLIYTLKDRIDAPAIDIQKIRIPEKDNLDDITQLEEDLVFTKFKLRGKFVHEEELFVGPRVYDDIRGYYVYTPFLITSEGPNKGKKVIVERGFIGEKKVSPQSRFESKLPEMALPMNEVEIECCLRRRVKPGNLAVDNDKKLRLLAYTDIFDIAKRSNSIPIYFQQMIDLSDRPIKIAPSSDSTSSSNQSSPWWKFWSKGGISKKLVETKKQQSGENEHYHQFTKNQFIRNGVPVGTHPEINIRNNHLEYLVTWYSLAIISSILIFFVVKKKKINPLQEKLKHAKKYQ